MIQLDYVKLLYDLKSDRAVIVELIHSKNMTLDELIKDMELINNMTEEDIRHNVEALFNMNYITTSIGDKLDTTNLVEIVYGIRGN